MSFCLSLVYVLLMLFVRSIGLSVVYIYIRSEFFGIR
jgi:hypothetical protein